MSDATNQPTAKEQAKSLEEALEKAINAADDDGSANAALVRAQLMTQLAIARSLRSNGVALTGHVVSKLVQHPGVCFQTHPVIEEMLREQADAKRNSLH